MRRRQPGGRRGGERATWRGKGVERVQHGRGRGKGEERGQPGERRGRERATCAPY